jgi:hypothetical protein
MSTNEFCDRAKKEGILLISVNDKTEFPEIAFDLATVGQKSLETAVNLLEKVTEYCE